MSEPPPIVFTWNRDEHDPARRAEAIREAVGFIATFLADDGDGDSDGDGDKRSLERQLEQDPEVGLNALYALGAIAAGFAVKNAEARGADPLDVLRHLEEALTRSADS